MRQLFHAQSGKLLGWRQQAGRRIQGYLSSGSFVGWYDPVVNATYDRHGQRIATGDLLASLLVRGG